MAKGGAKIMYTAAEALKVLKKKIQEDSEYAWGWHCNIAIVIQDEGLDYKSSNRAAARFMLNAFDVDVNNYSPFLKKETEKSELELAKEKYLGKWVKIKNENTAFKVIEVIEVLDSKEIAVIWDEDSIRLLKEIELLELEPIKPWGKGRCCVEDAPSEDGLYLVCDKGLGFIVLKFSKELTEKTWTWRTPSLSLLSEWIIEKGDLWWPLPEGEG